MSLIFWKNWSVSNRLTYLAGLGLLLLAFVWFGLAWYRGLANVVEWQVLSELVGLPASLHTVTDGLLTYPMPGQVQAVMGQFMAAPMQVYPLVATGTLVGLCGAIALLLAGVCRLPALLYRIGMGLFILLLAVCRFDVLVLPSFLSKWLFLLLTIVFGGTSYYVHAFRTNFSFAIRTGVFLGLIALTALGIGSVAGTTYPAQLLVSYALPGLLILSIAFIILIAIEPIAAMVWLTSVRRTDSAMGSDKPLGLYNFLFISVLYLVNLLLIWLKNTRTVDWDILTISPFLIVAVSIILGIWGFRRLLEQQERVSFTDAGAGVYLGAATLTLLTMAYAFATANDPLIEVFEDAIVYSHFAMGIGMTLYVALNFWPIYQQQLPVHRVLYKAKLADLPLFRLAGLVGIVGMVAGGNYFVVRQGQAALESAVADAYVAEQQPELAQTFYQQSLGHEFLQHKANYALASMALLRNDQATAAQFLVQSLQKQPSPQAFAALSATYRQTNLFFEAIKTLQRGIRAFPNSGELRTNLGYLYSKTAIADSAYYYLQSAVDLTAQDAVPLANLLGVYAKNPQILAADSTLAQQIEPRTDAAFAANSLALRLLTKQASPGDSSNVPDVPNWLAHSTGGQALDAGQFASLYNYALATPRPDTTLVNQLQRAALNPANQEVTDELLLATALARYKANQQPEAFDLLTQLAENDPRKRTAYRTTLGLLELEQGLNRRAAETFALNPTDTLSMLYRAVVLTKTGDLAAARPLWQTATRQDATMRGIAETLYGQKQPMTGQEKAFYVSFRPDDANRGRVWETIRDANLKTVAGAFLIDTYLDTRQYFYAQMILSQMGEPKGLSPFARSTENLSAVKIAAFRQKAAATDSLSKTFFVPAHQGLIAALRGRVFANAKRLTDARNAYVTALQLAPANAAIVAEAANFLRADKQIKPAYKAVLRALSVNENDPDLLKSYVLLCADQSLFEYAEQGLVKLNFATTPADYQAFEAAYQQKITAVENQRQRFTN